MKKNKRNSRIFSCVLAYLSWATAHSLRGEHATAYREVTAAKRLIADFGGEDVKPVFYDREWHIQFTLYRDECNRYYTVDATGGYHNDYHKTNQANVNQQIGWLEWLRDVRMREAQSVYTDFLATADSLLFEILKQDEYEDYWQNGDINDIPFDVAVNLWKSLKSNVMNIVGEAVAYRKVEL